MVIEARPRNKYLEMVEAEIQSDWLLGNLCNEINITTNVRGTIPTNSFNWHQDRQSRHQEQKVQDHMAEGKPGSSTCGPGFSLDTNRRKNP